MSVPYPKPPAGAPSQQPEIQQGRGLWPWLLLGVLLMAVAVVWRKAEERPAVPVRRAVTAVVQRGTLDIRIRLAGNVSARRFANIVAPKLRMPEPDSPMTVLRLATSGKFIQRGDVVAEFDTQGARDHLDDTRDGLRDRQNLITKQRVALDQEVESLTQQLRRAKARLDKARIDLRTLEVRSAIRKEQYQLAFDEAETDYQALQTQLPLRIASQAAALRINEINEDMERLHVGRHEQDIERMTIHAPSDGLAVVQTQNRRDGQRVTLAVGDRVAPGSFIMQVVDRSSLQVECSFNQADSRRFRIGQEATIRLEAYPDAQYRGKVTSIGALAQVPRRAQFFLRSIPIQVEILNPDERLLPNMTASADVLVEREENVLLMPAQAVKEENGQTYVYVRKSEGIERRAVTRGRVHGTQAALLDGVAEGEIVVVD